MQLLRLFSVVRAFSVVRVFRVGFGGCCRTVQMLGCLGWLLNGQNSVLFKSLSLSVSNSSNACLSNHQ